MEETERERWDLPPDGDEGRLEVGNMSATVLDAMDWPGYVCDRRHGLVAWNDRLRDELGDEDPAGMDPTGFVADEDVPRAREALERVADGEEATVELTLSTSDGARIREVTATPLRDDGEVRGLVGVIREPPGPAGGRNPEPHEGLTGRERREERLRTRRDELETLDRVNGLVQETIGALAAAASREGIEETVCERLGGSSLYRFAVTGTRRPGGEDVQPRAWAGAEVDSLDEVVPADAVDAGPVARTYETGEITVIRDVGSDPLFEPWREAALAHGFRSAAVVPLTHDEVVHGILVVYADRSGAFSPREVEAFEVLGEMVGYTISATQDRRLIEADAHVELTFRLTGGESFLAAVADRLDCPCRLLDSVTTSGDGTLHYVAVEGASRAAVEAVATDDHGATDVRHVRSDGGTDVFEVAATGVDPVASARVRRQARRSRRRGRRGARRDGGTARRRRPHAHRAARNVLWRRLARLETGERSLADELRA